MSYNILLCDIFVLILHYKRNKNIMKATELKIGDKFTTNEGLGYKQFAVIEVTKIDGYKVYGKFISGCDDCFSETIPYNLSIILEDNMIDKCTEYQSLCSDVKYQVGFIDDILTFDFDYIINTLERMKKMQRKLI